MTNKEFAISDTAFQKACEKAGIPVTPRQASKFRRNTGLVFRTLKGVSKDAPRR